MNYAAPRSRNYRRQAPAINAIPFPTICEIPVAIRYAIRSIEIFPARKRFDGYIALGCQIMGNEDHYLAQCSQALQNLSVQFSLAVGSSIIGAQSPDVAWSRAQQRECGGSRGPDLP